MPITALPTPPSRQRPSTFAAEGDAFLAALPTFVTEANTMASDVSTLETQAESSAATAAASANFKGEWSSLTGALNIPATVWHDGNLWILLSDLVNVTIKEPGVATEWVQFSHARTGDIVFSSRNMSNLGFLELDNSTVLQSAYSALFGVIGLQLRPSLVIPSVGSSGRTAYHSDSQYIYAYVYNSSTRTINVFSKADYTVATTITASANIRSIASNSTHVFVGLETTPYLAIYVKSGWGTVSPPTLSNPVYATAADDTYAYIQHGTSLAVVNASTFALVAGVAAVTMSLTTTPVILSDSSNIYCLDTNNLRVVAKSNLSSILYTIAHTGGNKYAQSANYIATMNGTSKTIKIIRKSDGNTTSITSTSPAALNLISCTGKYTLVSSGTNASVEFYSNSTGDLIRTDLINAGTTLISNEDTVVHHSSNSLRIYSESLEEVASFYTSYTPYLIDNDFVYCATTSSPYSTFIKLRDYDVSTEFVLPVMDTTVGVRGYIKT